VCAPLCVLGDFGCGSGEYCYPLGRTEAFSPLKGMCLRGGPGTDGASCETSLDCRADHVCASFDVGGSTVCHRICDDVYDDDRIGTCGADEVCLLMEDGDGELLPYGFCGPGCNPWSETSECPTGERCFPAAFQTDKGACIPEGPRASGEACSTDDQCADGLLCYGDTTATLECTALCRVGTSPGEPGYCEGCTALETAEGLNADLAYCAP
jgi:hypothetical protein